MLVAIVRSAAVTVFIAALAASVACSAPADGDADGERQGEDESSETGETNESPLSGSDGRISVVFTNRCAAPIVVGLMGQSSALARVAVGGSFERVIPGGDDHKPSIAYYGYTEGKFPGYGNMSLAEFTFNASDGNDYYDVSYVDGYNLPMHISAIGASCPVMGCAEKLLSSCPAGNRHFVNGALVACAKWGDRDNPNNAAARLFESRCSKVYSWSGDNSATQGCRAQDYRVTFCP